MGLKKSLLAGALLGLLGVLLVLQSKSVTEPKNAKEFASTAVMITRFDGRSGGTGVILESNETSSTILTNAHVCGVVANGGIVTSDRRTGTVASYKISRIHDMCLITSKTNFRVNTKIADVSPEVYSDANVIGHPSLLPNILTRGHFSEKRIVNVLVGFRPCKEEDFKENGLICMFLGGMPIIRTYESQVISATIMPGSSGSAVFDKNGQIAGLVFAGSGELSYGLIVPHEYVYNFVKVEQWGLEEQSTLLAQDKVNGMDESRKRLKEACNNLSTIENTELTNALKPYCPKYSNNLIIQE